MVNPSHRPAVGVGRFVFDVALQRWHEHAADQDGWCLQANSARAWHCPSAIEADLRMDGCLTYWVRLNQHRTPTTRPPPTSGG